MHKLTRILLLGLVAASSVQAATVTVSLKDASGKPLSDTVVYLQAASPAALPAAAEIQVEQKDKEFRPFVSVVPVGTTAYFPNHDGIGHHVYSFSQAKTFELPLSEAESSMSVLLDQPGIVTVGCNIHDWMVGYIQVVNTPYSGVSDNAGQLAISNVPAGNYTLFAWHPGIKSGMALEQALTVNESASVQQDLALDIKPEYFWKPPRPAEADEEQY